MKLLKPNIKAPLSFYPQLSEIISPKIEILSIKNQKARIFVHKVHVVTYNFKKK